MVRSAQAPRRSRGTTFGHVLTRMELTSDETSGVTTAMYHWAIAAPFFATPQDRWLTDFVPGAAHRFTKVPRVGEERSWHQRKSPVSGPSEWVQYVRQARRALAATEGGIVTVFPQLAATVAVQKRLARRDVPLLSWFFNTELGEGGRLVQARTSLRAVDRFVVHSTREIGIYSHRLGIPAERFKFVPLQYGGGVATDEIDEDEPFVFATGSGFRDYGTFFKAIDRLGYRTLVLAGPRVLSGLTPPKSVVILDQLPKEDIHRLVRRARVNVVPLTTGGANAGLVTMVEAYRHGRALVSTMRPGVEDYVIPDVNALVHDPGDEVGLASAIEAMWTDRVLRTRLNEGARVFGETWCTDEAAGRALGGHLDDLVAGR